MTYAWGILIVAGLAEVLWAYFLKDSVGFSKMLPSVGFFVFIILSMGLLAIALREIPLGVAYPVWTGIGAVGTVVAGAVFFAEPFGFLKLLFVGMIVLGILGLKLWV